MYCVQTFTGKQVNLACPKVTDICIEDIAHSLSLQCRFNGHTNRFYSVAQHSVLTASLLRQKTPGAFDIAFYGLMHDSAEAYTGDIVSPLKQLIPEISVLEQKLFKVIQERFHFRGEVPMDVRRIDQELLEHESRSFMATPIFDNLLPYMESTSIEPWPIGFIEDRFLEEFHTLEHLRGILCLN